MPSGSKCIDCAKCINPECKQRYVFKYPPHVHTQNKLTARGRYELSKNGNRPPENFDYDKMRERLRKVKSIDIEPMDASHYQRNFTGQRAPPQKKVEFEPNHDISNL
jgi:hypothetical protein